MSFSLLWLPDVLKDAGLKGDGWKIRGRGDVGEIKGVMCHHTVGAKTSNMPSLKTLVNGRSNLRGPLSQLGLGRDGTFYVIAAGRANHAGKGNWQNIDSGNSSFVGIEGENTGVSSDFPWPEVQMDAYQRGVAAILKHIGQGAIMCCGHKEYALPRGRNPDPLFDMSAFRLEVDAVLQGRSFSHRLIPSDESGEKRRPTLRRGSSGELVKHVQSSTKLGIVNGRFGPKTEAAVRAFQRAVGLVPDGIVGPKTWAAIDGLAASS